MKASLSAIASLFVLQLGAAAQDTPETTAPTEPVRFGGFLAQVDGLAQPASVAVSHDGEIWVAETWGRALSVYDAKGKLIQRMSAEVPPNLKLNDPRGLAISADGTVYLSDTQRVVGFGWDSERQRHNGLKTAITYALVEPLGLCVDGERLYVADAGLQLVVVFDRRSSKVISAFGGFGSRDGEFRRPVDVAVDEEGGIYVADQGNRRVQRFDKEGKFLGAFGGCGAPASVEYAAGRLYVADRDHDRVRVFDRVGKPLYDWGAGRLRGPDAFALERDGSFAVVCEGLEDRLQIFGPEDEASRALAKPSADAAPPSFGGGIAVRGKLCVVLEPASPCGLALDTSGSEPLLLAHFGEADAKRGALVLPAGIALDEKERAWICDPVLKRLVVVKLDRKPDAPLAPDPALPRFFKSINFDAADGGEPVAVALDAAGHAYVLEARGEVLVLQADLEKGAQAHELPAKSIVSPSAIAVSPDGTRILVADPGAHALHVLQAPEKAWKKMVWKADGLEPRPSGVAIAKDGSVFVTDEQRNEVVKLSPALERVASWGVKGAGHVEFNKPRALSIDDQGQLWVLDLGNRRVQVLTQEGAFVRSFDAASLAPK